MWTPALQLRRWFMDYLAKATELATQLEGMAKQFAQQAVQGLLIIAAVFAALAILSRGDEPSGSSCSNTRWDRRT